jgi:hypothetical protein
MILSWNDVEGFRSMVAVVGSDYVNSYDHINDYVFRKVFDWLGKYNVLLTSVEALISYADSEGFFVGPASTKFHGKFEGGLAAHSIGVLQKTLGLLEAFGFKGNVQSEWFFGLVVAALFHDLCKAGLYDVGFRNVKNEQGVWNKEPYYKVKDGATGVGHGTESLRRLSRFVNIPYEWELAVAWHMGSFGLTSEENLQYMNCCRQHREVLLLHTADMLQAVSGGA